VNHGSVGLQALEGQNPHPHRVENGSPDARYAIIEKRAGDWIPMLISVPYEHQAMADLARANQRPDWEHALRTGYMA
jgi:hypothetical protein